MNKKFVYQVGNNIKEIQMLLCVGSAQPTAVPFDKRTSSKDPKFYCCDRTQSLHYQPPIQTMHDKSETEALVE